MSNVAARQTGHRSYSVGAGCVRSASVKRSALKIIRSKARFVCIDRQPEMLPAIMYAKHRAALAPNGEDIC